jgi:hypothetical protein
MKQISVLTDNRSGILAELSRALAARNVNIESIDGEGSEQTGVVTLTVDLYDEALQALQEAGFRAVSEDALIVRMKDEPGALARVAERFKAAEINIKSLRFLSRDDGFALVTLVTEDNERAKELVADLMVG